MKPVIRPVYEKILSDPERSFPAYAQDGVTIDCELHRHPECELILILDGFGTRLVNDDISPFGVGTFNLLGSLVPHHYLSTPPAGAAADWSRILVVQFDEGILRRLWDLPELAAVKRLLAEAALGVEFAPPVAAELEPMVRELIACPAGARRLVLLLDILARLAETARRPLSGACLAAVPGDCGERIRKALKWIHQGMAQNRQPSLAATAAHVGMAPEGFSRYFRRVTGKNFIDYIVELKIARAANLLLHSEQSVLEICEAAGFHNLSNFNRHFRRMKGASPIQFRRQYRRLG